MKHRCGGWLATSVRNGKTRRLLETDSLICLQLNGNKTRLTCLWANEGAAVSLVLCCWQCRRNASANKKVPRWHRSSCLQKHQQSFRSTHGGAWLTLRSEEMRAGHIFVRWPVCSKKSWDPQSACSCWVTRVQTEEAGVVAAALITRQHEADACLVDSSF